MGRQARKQSVPATELLNFHFSTPAASTTQTQTQPSSRNNSRSGNSGRGNSSHKKQQYQRTAQDRASARKKAHSANFYLHSSPDHAFALTRRANSKVNNGEAYSFSGVDAPVSWDSVRIVKHFIPFNLRDQSEESACPICLCDFVCPRITKCGHSFCLSCILHHVQSQTASNPYAAVKCPCCGIPLIVDDLRVVIMERIFPPAIHTRIRLRKLHRQKGCDIPYIPVPNEPMHSNPHTAPSQSDPDARFSRFNYVDPTLFVTLLRQNWKDLQQELNVTPTSSTDHMFLVMSLEIVASQNSRTSAEFDDEMALHHRFSSPASGMYQEQNPALIFHDLSDRHGHGGRARGGSISSHHSRESEGGKPAALPPSSPSMQAETGSGSRNRGDSISSYKSLDSISTGTSKKVDGESPSGKTRFSREKPGSMYLEETEAVHFYQAEDGRLVFLNGFNMACLLADFAKTKPAPKGNDDVLDPPLPDFVEGQTIDMETVHLTPEMRKRMPFLDHIPLFSDIIFVELDLGHAMSDATKIKFKADLARRRKKRQSKHQAKKRADRDAKREEAKLINERKAMLQRVDPDDNFFHALQSIEFEEALAAGVDFGPVLGALGEPRLEATVSNSTAIPALNFSQACRLSDKRLVITSEEAFPSLGGKSNATSHSKRLEESSAQVGVPALESMKTNSHTQQPGPGGKKKKGKGQKVSLFSTGAQRNTMY